MKKKVFVLLIIITSLGSCIKIGEPEETPSNIDKDKLLELVNDVRSKGCDCGGESFPAVDELVWNHKLEEAAQNHSDWMEKEDKLDHTGENGSSPGDRIADVGYEYTMWAENIAWNYTSEEAVIEGWLGSDGHCKNIMNANVTEMGVALSGAYWTQVFAAPK